MPSNTGEKRKTRRLPRLLILICAGYLFMTLIFSLATPIWQGPDEHEHFLYIKFLSSEHRLPHHYEDAIKQDHHPPLYYGLGACLFSVLRLFDSSLAGEEGKAGEAGEEGALPATLSLPGSYSIHIPLAEPLVLREKKVGVGSWLIFPLRFFSIAAGLGTVIAIYFLGRLIFPRKLGIAFCAASLAALLPQFNFISGVINNDALAAFTATVALALLVRAFLDGWKKSIRFPIIAGLFIGLACLTKVSNLFLALPVVLLLFRKEKGPCFWRGLIIMLGTMSVVSGWWYVLNIFRYGDPLIVSGQVATMTERLMLAPQNLSYWAAYLTETFESFWGRFGLMEIRLPQWIFLLYTGMTCTAACGLFFLFWRGEKRGEMELREKRGIFFLLFGVLGVFLLVSFGHLTFVSFQGRYLFPALGGIALLMVTGFRHLFGKHLLRSHVLIFYALFFLLDGIAIERAFLPFYYPKKEKVQEEHVLLYEDPGNERLSPHLVRGAVFKKWMVYASPLLPEFNVAHDPERVVFRMGKIEETTPLIVRFTTFGFDPDTGLGNYSYQRILAGPLPLNLAVPVLSSPNQYVYPIPPGGIEDGELVLTFEKVMGTRASVAEIWIEKARTGGQEFSPLLVFEAEGIPAEAAVKRGDPDAHGMYALVRPPGEGDDCLFQGLEVPFPIQPGNYRMVFRVKGEGGEGEGGYFAARYVKSGTLLFQKDIRFRDLQPLGSYVEIEAVFSLEEEETISLDGYWKGQGPFAIDRISLSRF